MFLDSDQIWIVGNIPELLLEVFANTLHPNLSTVHNH
jgi:hypothetical protein